MTALRPSLRFLKRLLPMGLVLVGNVDAQEVRCSASVENSVIEAGLNFTLRIEVSGTELGEVAQPVLPDVPGLEIVYPNAGVSTSIQIVNGRRTDTKTFTYVLRARSTGQIKFPSVAVLYRGQTCRTQPLVLEIVPSGQISGSQGGLSKNEDVFIAVVPSRREVYVGEQLSAYLKIFTRVAITQYSPEKMPNFAGFWVEDFPLKQPLEAVRETVNGVAYNAYTIRRSALFPTRAGQLTIEPAEIECELRIPRRRGGAFDDFFSPFTDPFGQTVVKKFSSAPVPITVKELPAEGRPVDFSGLVGQFDISTGVDKTRLRTGEALTYTVKISGAGNIMSAVSPANPFPDDFEKYDPRTSSDLHKGSNVLSGQKTFEFVVIPRSSRTFEIPPPGLSYFDPVARTYVTKSGASHSITVDPGSGGYSATSGLSREEVELISKDIRYIKPASSWHHTSERFYRTWWFAALWILPALALVGVRAYRVFVEKQSADAVRWKYRQASPLAKRRLKAAEKLLKERKTDVFYTEMARTLTGLVADKLNLSGSAVLREDVLNRIRERGVDASLAEEFEGALSLCDEARYAPDRDSRVRVEEVYEHVRRAILNLDRAL